MCLNKKRQAQEKTVKDELKPREIKQQAEERNTVPKTVQSSIVFCCYLLFFKTILGCLSASVEALVPTAMFCPCKLDVRKASLVYHLTFRSFPPCLMNSFACQREEGVRT